MAKSRDNSNPAAQQPAADPAVNLDGGGAAVPASAAGASFGQRMLDGLGGSDAAALANEAAQVAVSAEPINPATTAAIQAGGSASAAGLDSPAAAPAVDPYLQRLAELGFTDVTDPTIGRDRMVEAFVQERERRAAFEEQLAQSQQLAQMGQQFYQLYEQDPEFRQVVDRRQSPQNQRVGQPQAAQVQPVSEESWWNPPAYDETSAANWRERKVDATGQIIEDWKQNTPLQVRQAHDAHVAYMQDWATKLVHRPQEILPQIIQKEASKIAKQLVREEFQRQELEREQVAVQQEITNENPWVFARDAVTGQPLRDASGSWVLSREGQMANAAVNQIMQAGITNPRQAWEIARAQTLVNNPQLAAQVLGFQNPAGGMTGGATGNPLAAAMQTGQPVAQQQAAARADPAKARQAAYLQNRGGTAAPPNRNGAEVAAGGRPARRTFGETAMANMIAEGFPAN